jgi:hypothetical protein
MAATVLSADGEGQIVKNIPATLLPVVSKASALKKMIDFKPESMKP